MHSGDAKLASKNDYSNPLGFLDMSFFIFFFHFFNKELRYKMNLPNFKLSTLKRGTVGLYAGFANLASKYDCSNYFGFHDMEFVLISFV